MDLNEFISVLKFPFNRLHAYSIGNEANEVRRKRREKCNVIMNTLLPTYLCVFNALNSIHDDMLNNL